MNIKTEIARYKIYSYLLIALVLLAILIAIGVPIFLGQQFKDTKLDPRSVLAVEDYLCADNECNCGTRVCTTEDEWKDGWAKSHGYDYVGDQTQDTNTISEASKKSQENVKKNADTLNKTADKLEKSGDFEEARAV